MSRSGCIRVRLRVYVLLLLMPFTVIFGQSDEPGTGNETDAEIDAVSGASVAEEVDLPTIQRRIAGIHTVTAIASAGFLTLGSGIGTWHYIDMMLDGHEYCDAHGEPEMGDPDFKAVSSAGITSAWNTPLHQVLRVVHSSSIGIGTSLYVTTAALELATPRLDTGSDRRSRPDAHRRLFVAHASLMAANMVLGFLESYGLSQGNHVLAGTLGALHLMTGWAAPAVILASGLNFVSEESRRIYGTDD